MESPFFEADRRRLECVHIGRCELRQGDRVRLWPRPRGDVLDMALRGKTATIEAIEEDYDNRTYLAVTVDDDPGRDLGLLRQPGHRFFFLTDEVEPVENEPVENEPVESEPDERREGEER